MNNIVIVVDIDMLCAWSQPILKEYCQQLQIETLKNKKSSWFGGWGQQDDKGELEKIEQFFKEITSDSVEVKKKPSEYVWFELGFNLESGSIQVSQKREGVVESISLVYYGLGLKVK